MKIEEIKELAEILEHSSLDFMEVQDGDFRVRMGKTPEQRTESAVEYSIPEQAERSSYAPQNSGSAGTAAAESGSALPAVPGSPVCSPMVGIFYEAASPEDAPFVQEGQTVEKGQILCIIEAMKLMNEITAEKSGVITKVCVENGRIVEYGQPLFYIRS